MHKQTIILTIALALLLGACGSESGGGAADITGTYQLDKSDAMRDAALEVAMSEMPEGADEGMRQAMETMVTQMLEGMQIDLTIEAGGTWTVNGQGPMGEFVEKGTWTRDGDQVTFTTESRDGEATEDGETKVVTIDGDTLRLPKDESMPFEMVMRRKR